MLDLSSELLRFALESETKLAGDRSKVGWANNQSTGRLKRKPPGGDSSAHNLGPLKSKKNYFCQQCYRSMQEKDAEKPEAERLAKGEVRRQCNKAVGYCEACNWRFCSECDTISNHQERCSVGGGKRGRRS